MSETILMRWMLQRDMPAVLAIEADSFDWPWSRQDFLDCLRERNSIGMVATLGDRDVPVGFVVYELAKRRIKIVDLAVSPRWRRIGVGRRMIDKLKGKLGGERRRLVARVDEGNLAGHLFFRAEGFEAVAIDRSFYHTRQLDARDAYRIRVPRARVPPAGAAGRGGDSMMASTPRRRLALYTAGHMFVVIYRDGDVAAACRAVGRWAGDPALPFTWYDAAAMCRELRRPAKKFPSLVEWFKSKLGGKPGP